MAIGKTGRIFVTGIVIASIVLTLLGWMSLFGVTSQSVTADNSTVTLNVNNVAPSVTDVSVNAGAGTLTLSESSSVVVTCNGTVNDTNGNGDIANATAHFYNLSGSAGTEQSPVSNRSHYRNNTCFVQNDSSLGTIGYAICTFNVQFFALNTTWQCNLTATDYDNLKNASTDNIAINDLIALEVNDSIDYGTSDPLVILRNRTTVVNTGNVQFDIGLYGYSRYILDNLSFNCTGGNQNISVDLHRYNITGNDSASYATGMTNLSSRQVNEAGFNLPPRNDTTNSTRLVFWAIQPPAGVKGFCRGFVVYNTFIG